MMEQAEQKATYGNYKCEVCKLRHRSKTALNGHMRYHKRRFICNQCNKSLTSVIGASTLQEHFNIHNNSGSLYKCEHCSQIFVKKESFRKHMYRNHGSVPCGICHFMMMPDGGIDRHMTRQHVKTFTCSSCNKVFNDYAAIATHIHTSLNGVCGADAWPCTKCGENFNTESDLRGHIDECRRRVINGAGPSKHTLRSSVARRKETRTFTCSSCNKVFNDYAAIATHIHTSPNGVCGADAWPCTECGENFNTESDLRGHISGCREVKKAREERERAIGKYKCEWCAKIFPQLGRYRRHVMTHTDERPFACPECPKAFRRKVELKRHMTVHTRERAHQCSQCEKAYSCKWALSLHRRSVHMTVHTGERKHQCPQCGKTFTRSSGVQLHRRAVHENLRPYECTICSKKFTLLHNLKKHLNTIHKNEEEKKVGKGVKK